MRHKYLIAVGALFALIFVASVPTYYGNLNVPTGGTITDSNFTSGNCVQTTTSGLFIATSCPTSSPDVNGNITATGSYPYTLTVATPCPTEGTGITITGAWPCTIAVSDSLTGITAGTNIVVSTPNPDAPTVSVTAAPTFTGLLTDSYNNPTAVDITNGGLFVGAGIHQNSSAYNIISGPITSCPIAAGGALCTGITSGTGELDFGGASASCDLDWAITTLSTLTASCPLTSTGRVQSGGYSGMFASADDYAPTSGYYGNVVVAQPTSAPTEQPGTADVSTVIANRLTIPSITSASCLGTDNDGDVQSSDTCGSGSLTGITAGTNIAVSTPNPDAPTVSVTAAPTFTGNVTTPSVNLGTDGAVYDLGDGSIGIAPGSGGLVYFTDYTHTVTYAYIKLTGLTVAGAVTAKGSSLQTSLSGNESGTTGNGIMETTSGPTEVYGCVGSSACPINFYSDGISSASTVQFDASGNVTATNFFVGSRRAWKTNISPFRFDPLDVLARTDFAEYDCKDPRCGPVGDHKIGIIADDSPVQIAGSKHDHYDAFALAAIDGAAIRELATRTAAAPTNAALAPRIAVLTRTVRTLEIVVGALVLLVLGALAWCAWLTMAFLIGSLGGIRGN